MSGQRQGVQSTKKVPSKKEKPQEEGTEIKPLEGKYNISIKIYNVQESFDDEHAERRKNDIHKEQMGKFPPYFQLRPQAPNGTLSHQHQHHLGGSHER